MRSDFINDYDPKQIARDYEFLYIAGCKKGDERAFSKGFGDPRRVVFALGLYIGNVIAIDKDSDLDMPNLDECIALISAGIHESQAKTTRTIIASGELFDNGWEKKE